MVHRVILLVLSVLLSIPSVAQSHWAWARTDAGITYSINPTYPRQVVAAEGGHALWGVIRNNKMTYRQVMLGDYAFYDLDSLGIVKATELVTGKISVIAARADAAGNWYVLGTFYDSIMLSNGMSLVRTATGSEYFMLRLHAGTLAPDWLQPIGGDYYCATDCFTLRGGNIFLPIDSADGTSICRYNPATGARTTMWSQGGRSNTAYIDADAAGNIYLTGHCVQAGGLNFNGVSSIPALPQYAWYVARYHHNGPHHWHHWLTDITCTSRSFMLGNSNSVYLSGTLSDSTSLGSFHFSKPISLFNSDFILARLDSNGTLVWAQQRPITSVTQGPVSFSSAFHMAAVDTSIYMFCETRGATIWGGGVFHQTLNNSYHGTLVAYGASGGALSLRAIEASYVIGQHIVTDGTDIWVTGVAHDNNVIRFDTVNLQMPSATYIPYIARLNLKSRAVVATGIKPLAASAAASAWPNPVKNVLHIRSNSSAQLVIRDMTGRVVWQGDIRGEFTDVETSGWPRGLYLLESQGSGGRDVVKILLD